MKSYHIDKNTEIICEWVKTRNAFKHTAKLLVNGNEKDSVKICYQNRTWESFEFESVIQKLLSKTGILTERKKKNFMDKISGKAHQEVKSSFAMIGNIAKIGDILCQNQKDKNDWKARMLNAGLKNKGLVMPDDWNTLSEDVKEKRLNAVIDNLK